mgnify:CR=1 FL=1
MKSDKNEQQNIIELSNMLSKELRDIDIAVGNLELLTVAENIIKNFCCKYYQNGLNDASLIFSKCADKFEEEIYILEQNNKDNIL